MPELPDVEVFRRRLAHHGLHRAVRRAEVVDASVLGDTSRQRLQRALRGRMLLSTRRHGKHLLAAIEDDGWLVLHFGMTGFLQPLSADPDDELPDHLRLLLHLDDGTRIAYVDQRKLGFVSVTVDADHYIAEQQLGPDALTLSFTEMRDLLSPRRGSIKSALMDQALIAGIGNIYSDEILFHAKIHPRRTGTALAESDLRRLHRQTGRVLRMAADRHADRAGCRTAGSFRTVRTGCPARKATGRCTSSRCRVAERSTAPAVSDGESRPAARRAIRFR